MGYLFNGQIHKPDYHPIPKSDGLFSLATSLMGIWVVLAIFLVLRST